jgi:hypothetical protein
MLHNRCDRFFLTTYGHCNTLKLMDSKTQSSVILTIVFASLIFVQNHKIKMRILPLSRYALLSFACHRKSLPDVPSSSSHLRFLSLLSIRPHVHKRINRLWKQRNNHTSDTPPASHISPILGHINIPPYEHQECSNTPEISRYPTRLS